MTHAPTSLLSTLLDRSALGDLEAFGELYDSTITDVFLLATLSSDHFATEVVEDLYSRVWRESNAYRPSGLSPRAWVLSFMRSSARAVHASHA